MPVVGSFALMIPAASNPTSGPMSLLRRMREREGGKKISGFQVASSVHFSINFHFCPLPNSPPFPLILSLSLSPPPYILPLYTLGPHVSFSFLPEHGLVFKALVCASHVFSSQSPTDIGVVMMFHSPPTKVRVKVARHISGLLRYDEGGGGEEEGRGRRREGGGGEGRRRGGGGVGEKRNYQIVHTHGIVSLRTAQISVQACSSEFTRYPPHSVSVSSLADSASCVFASSPTATTTWSASSCERKEG